MSMNSLLLLVHLAMVSTSMLGSSDQENSLRIAHQIARYDGYAQSSHRHIDYEITDPIGHPTYPGYVTIQIRANLQTVFDVSINIPENTAYDFTRCLVFDYPFMRITKLSNSKYKTSLKSFMSQNGCESYAVLRRRGQES